MRSNITNTHFSRYFHSFQKFVRNKKKALYIIIEIKFFFYTNVVFIIEKLKEIPPFLQTSLSPVNNSLSMEK